MANVAAKFAELCADVVSGLVKSIGKGFKLKLCPLNPEVPPHPVPLPHFVAERVTEGFWIV